MRLTEVDCLVEEEPELLILPCCLFWDEDWRLTDEDDLFAELLERLAELLLERLEELRLEELDELERLEELDEPEREDEVVEPVLLD